MAENTIGKAYVQIMPSAKGIKGNVESVLANPLNAAGEKSGASFGGAIAGSLKKYLGAAAIGSALTKSITGGAALQQSIGGVETLYKGSAEIIKNYARDAWKSAGISANEYMEQSTSFAAALMTSTGGNTQKAAEAANMAIMDMSDNANKFGTSIESIQAAYQGFSRGQYQLLDNLKLGYGGTKGEAERLLRDAEKISGQKYDLDNLNDFYNAIHVIQTEMGVTGTTAKEGATTISGSFGAMKSAANDFLANIALGGEGLGASLNNVFSSVGTFALNLVPALGNIIKSIPQALSSVDWLSVASSLAEQVDKWVDAAVEWVGGLGEGMQKGMPSFVAKLPQFVSTVADIINRNAPKLLLAGGRLVFQLAVGFVKSIPTFIKNLPKFFIATVKAISAFSWANLGRTCVVKLTNGVKGGIGGVGTAVRNGVAKIPQIIRHPFEVARQAVVKIIERIKSMFPIKLGRIFSNIKVPKFDIKWKRDADVQKALNIPGIPETRAIWNAKGGIFDSATIFGYGVGEKGAEAILPLEPFWNKMDAMAEQVAQTTAGGGVVEIVLDGSVIAKSTINYINGQVARYGTSPINV